MTNVDVQNHQEMYQRVAHVLITSDDAAYLTVIVDKLAGQNAETSTV